MILKRRLLLLPILLLSSTAWAGEASLPICVPDPDSERDAVSFLNSWVATARVTLTREPCPLPGHERYVGRFHERRGTIFFTVATPGGGRLEKAVPWLARLDAPLSDLLQVGRLSEFSVWVEALLAEDRLMTEWERMLSAPNPRQPPDGDSGAHAGGAGTDPGSGRSGSKGPQAPVKAGAGATGIASGKGGPGVGGKEVSAGGRGGRGGTAAVGGAGSGLGSTGGIGGSAGVGVGRAGAGAGSAGVGIGGPGSGVGGPGPGVGGAGLGVEGPGPGVGSTRPGVGGPGSGIGSAGSGVGSAGSEIGSTGSEVGSTGSGVGSTGPGVGSTGSGVGGPGSGLGSTGSEIGGPGSGLGSTGSGVGRPRSEIGGPGSGLGSAGSEIGSTGSAVGGTGPGVGGAGSGIGSTGSAVGGTGPGIGGAGSGIGSTGSEIGSTRPGVGGAGSGVEGAGSGPTGAGAELESLDSEDGDLGREPGGIEPAGLAETWSLAAGSGFRIRSPDILQHELAVALSLGPIGLRMGWQPSTTWRMGGFPASIESFSLEAAWLLPLARGKRWAVVGNAGVAVDQTRLDLLYLNQPSRHVSWDVGPMVGGTFTWRTGSGFGLGVSGALQWMPTAPITHVGPVGPYGRMNHLGARLGGELSFQK